MSSEQWKLIRESANPYAAFFSLWAIKESVIKADGQGLSIPLTELHVINSKVHLYNKVWYVKEINLHKDYACCLASNKENPVMNIKKMSIADL